MKFSSKIKFSFRGRLSILTVGMVLAVLSLLYTNKLADVLKQKEQNDVELVSDAAKEEFIRSQQSKLAKKTRTRSNTTEKR